MLAVRAGRTAGQALLRVEASDPSNRFYVATQAMQPMTRILEDSPIVSRTFDRAMAEKNGVPNDVLVDLAKKIEKRRGELEPLFANERDLYWTSRRFRDAAPDQVRRIAEIRTNAFRARSSTAGMDQLKLFPRGALFNHSCWPNAAVVEADDGDMVVTTIRPVAAGEPVSICYDDDILCGTLERRQVLLKSSWGFKCVCPRCSGAEPEAPPDSALLDPEVDEETSLRWDAEFMWIEFQAERSIRTGRWIDRCKALIDVLCPEDWRAIQCRKWYLEMCTERFPGQLDPQLRKQITALSRLMPRLHPAKSIYYQLFLMYSDDPKSRRQHGVMELDPAAMEVMMIADPSIRS